MKTITATIFGLLICLTGWSQTGISGRVTEPQTGEPVLFATLSLLQNGHLIFGTETDLNGHYHFINIAPGKYSIEVDYVGFSTTNVDSLVVVEGKITHQDIELSSESVTLSEVVVVEYKVPIIEQDNTCAASVVTRKGRRSFSRRSSNNNKNAVTIRGSRSNNTQYYVDGVRVQGKLIPQRKAEKGEKPGKTPENSFIKPQKSPTSTFSIDVDHASYSQVRRFINQHQAPPIDIVRIEEMINYFNYNYDGPADHHPFAIHTELSDCPWTPKHHLLKIGLQGKPLPATDRPPSNIILLLDISGSMDSPDRLPLAKKAFKKLIQNLQADDQVAILTFSNNGQVQLPFTKVSSSSKIFNTLEGIQIGGGTNGEAGLRLAYEEAEKEFESGRNTRIVIASDGDFNIGAATLPEVEKLIEEKRTRGIYLSILGFGTGNFKDRKLNTLAQKGNGNYAYIDNIKEACKALEEEMGQTIHVIAEDVKIQIDFNPDFVASYRLIGYETRLMEKEDFEDDTKDAGELGPGHNVTALYELEIKKEVSGSELADLKLRYKLPKEKQSYFIRKQVAFTPTPLATTSNNFRFAASVAAFGMILQQSEYCENYDHDQILKLANQAKGEDHSGYRQEFIELVKANRDFQLTAELNHK